MMKTAATAGPAQTLASLHRPRFKFSSTALRNPYICPTSRLGITSRCHQLNIRRSSSSPISYHIVCITSYNSRQPPITPLPFPRNITYMSMSTRHPSHLNSSLSPRTRCESEISSCLRAAIEALYHVSLTWSKKACTTHKPFMATSLSLEL